MVFLVLLTILLCTINLTFSINNIILLLNLISIIVNLSFDQIYSYIRLWFYFFCSTKPLFRQLHYTLQLQLGDWFFLQLAYFLILSVIILIHYCFDGQCCYSFLFIPSINYVHYGPSMSALSLPSYCKIVSFKISSIMFYLHSNIQIIIDDFQIESHVLIPSVVINYLSTQLFLYLYQFLRLR